MIRFTEDLVDHMARKNKDLVRDQRRRLKQMYRAASDNMRAEQDAAFRDRRLAKQFFAHV